MVLKPLGCKSSLCVAPLSHETAGQSVKRNSPLLQSAPSAATVLPKQQQDVDTVGGQVNNHAHQVHHGHTVSITRRTPSLHNHKPTSSLSSHTRFSPHNAATRTTHTQPSKPRFVFGFFFSQPRATKHVAFFLPVRLPPPRARSFVLSRSITSHSMGGAMMGLTTR